MSVVKIQTEKTCHFHLSSSLPSTSITATYSVFACSEVIFIMLTLNKICYRLWDVQRDMMKMEKGSSWNIYEGMLKFLSTLQVVFLGME